MLKKVTDKLQKASLVVTGAIAGLSTGAFAANDALNQINNKAGTKIDTSNLSGDGIVKLILNIVNIFLGVVTAVAVLMLIYGAFIWITGFGAAGKGEEKGRGYVKNAIIGLVIALMAYVIVAFIGSIFSDGGFINSLIGG